MVGIFKKSEIPIEVLQGVLSAFKTVEGEWTGDFLMSLTKAENFEMTLMFCEDSDRETLKSIASKLDPKMASKLMAAYQSD